MRSSTSSVHLQLPLNITNEENFLFEPYSSYLKPKQKIRQLNNIFVGNTGFCLNGKGLVPECHHNLPGQLDYYQNEAAKFYYEALDNPEQLIYLENDINYLVIHHPWFNYYHWISESIFRLWLVRKRLSGLTLVLPDYYGNADFIMGSLRPFNLNNIYFIPAGKSLMVRNLCLPQIKPVCDSYNIRQVRQVRKFYISYIQSHQIYKVKKINRLYISRKLAGRRAVVNELQILKILEDHEFEIFYPEEHSFLEQVAIFSQVSYLIGTHGSGLTNMLFMRDGTSLLELHKNETNELDHPSPLFWYLANALKINYYHQSCDTAGRKDYFEGDYIIDIELFEKNLVIMLANKGI